jgi:hypothetical protein
MGGGWGTILLGVVATIVLALGGGRRRLQVVNVVGVRAVEGVAVDWLSAEVGRLDGHANQPRGEGSIVGGNEDIVTGDTRTVGLVLAALAHLKRGFGLVGQEGQHGAIRGADITPA